MFALLILLFTLPMYKGYAASTPLMQPGFNYRHLHYFWVTAHAGRLACAAGVGVLAAPLAAASGLAQQQLLPLAHIEDLGEPCHLMHSQRKLQHPLLRQWCARPASAVHEGAH